MASAAPSDRPTTLRKPQSTDRPYIASNLPKQGLPPQSTDRIRSKPSSLEKKGNSTAVSAAEQIQIKAFVRWWNATAQLPIEKQIIDLTVGLESGELPLILLSHLTSKEYKINRDPKSRAQIVENGATFVKELKKLGLILKSTPEDSNSDDKRSLLMNMTWQLITHFSSTSSSDASSETLLEWLRANSAGANGVKVESWTSMSLLDGSAFLAILENYEPGCIEMMRTAWAFEPPGARLSQAAHAQGIDISSTKANLQMAFDTAHDVFGVPKLLDASDLVSSLSSSAAATTGSFEMSFDAKSLQAYTLVLRQALRRHVEMIRLSVLEDCANFKEEARAIASWGSEAAEMLCGLQSEVSTLDRKKPEHVEQAEIMLADLEAEWRQKSKTVMTGRAVRLRDVRLPAATELLRAVKSSDDRIRDGDGVTEEAAVVAALESDAKPLAKTASSPAASLAVAEAELVTALGRAEASMRSVEEAEDAFSAALWQVLAEKRTDMIVNESEELALKVGEHVRIWAAKLSAPTTAPALKFDPVATDSEAAWPKGEGDAGIALSQTIDLLDKWINSEHSATLPGLHALAELKDKCLTQHTDGSKRRAEEGREPLEITTDELRASLETEWQWMIVHADVLRAKIMPMVAWQQEQLARNKRSLMRLHKTLEQNLPPAPSADALLEEEVPQPSTRDKLGTMTRAVPAPTIAPEKCMNESLENSAKEDEGNGTASRHSEPATDSSQRNEHGNEPPAGCIIS